MWSFNLVSVENKLALIRIEICEKQLMWESNTQMQHEWIWHQPVWALVHAGTHNTDSWRYLFDDSVLEFVLLHVEHIFLDQPNTGILVIVTWTYLFGYEVGINTNASWMDLWDWQHSVNAGTHMGDLTWRQSLRCLKHIFFALLEAYLFASCWSVSF